MTAAKTPASLTVSLNCAVLTVSDTRTLEQDTSGALLIELLTADGYLARVVDRDFVEQGHIVRNPAALRRWMTAYAAATAKAIVQRPVAQP